MKCKICGKLVTNQQVKDELAIKITYNEKNLYFCSDKCCKKYFENEKTRKYIRESIEKINKFVKENIFYFNKIPILPTSLFTRINDLYNGTKRMGNKEIKNGIGEGYPYEVILETIMKQKDTINYFLENKLADAKESQKVNYMFAIIENSINDIYIEHINMRKQKIAKEINMQDIDTTEIENTKRETNDLTDFFTDWN